MTGRGVPVIIPQETKRMLDFLSDTSIREKGGVKKGNSYMFANTGEAVVRAGDALSDVKGRLKLKEPKRILATNLRKYTATISQVLSLNDQQMKYICNHLGHTQKIHDQYYRQTSGLIERIDIAKLMLIQDHNLVSRYANKKLEEIQFEDIVEDMDEISDKITLENQDENPEKNLENIEGDLDVMQADCDFLDEPCGKKRKASNRKRWSDSEEQEVKKYFSDYFSGAIIKTCPTRKKCLDAVKYSQENQGIIWKRGWENIKKKVNNMLKKNQKK